MPEQDYRHMLIEQRHCIGCIIPFFLSIAGCYIRLPKFWALVESSSLVLFFLESHRAFIMDYSPPPESHNKTWIIIGIIALVLLTSVAVFTIKIMPSQLDISTQTSDVQRWERGVQTSDIALARQHFAFIKQQVTPITEHANAYQLLGRLQLIINRLPDTGSKNNAALASVWFDQASTLAPGEYTNWLYLVDTYIAENAPAEQLNHAMKFALRQGRNEAKAMEILPEHILRHWDKLDEKNKKLSARFFDMAFDTHESALHILNVTQKTNRYDVMLSLIPHRPKYMDILVYYKQHDKG